MTNFVVVVVTSHYHSEPYQKHFQASDLFFEIIQILVLVFKIWSTIDTTFESVIEDFSHRRFIIKTKIQVEISFNIILDLG